MIDLAKAFRFDRRGLQARARAVAASIYGAEAHAVGTTVVVRRSAARFIPSSPRFVRTPFGLRPVKQLLRQRRKSLREEIRARAPHLARRAIR